MEYDKDIIIPAFDLLLASEFQNWSIASISPEEYFELRIPQVHHHCPCDREAARMVMDHFIRKGVSIGRYHKPDSAGVLFLRENN